MLLKFKSKMRMALTKEVIENRNNTETEYASVEDLISGHRTA